MLFLKHNLNARAFVSLQGTAVKWQRDVDKLIAAMRRSIDESNRFIATMKTDESRSGERFTGTKNVNDLDSIGYNNIVELR